MRLPTSSTRALLAAFAVLGLASLSSAQTVSVKTNPVGAVTKTIPVGLTSLGITLLNPDILVSNATSNTSSSITLSGISNVGALLTAGIPYYIEAVNGTLEGDRFDVDTAATIAAANGTVVLTASSPNNTMTLAVGNADGSQFALRRHVTLGQLQASFSSPLVGNNNSGLADQVQFLNPTATGFTTYYLRGNLTEWRLVGGTTNLTNTVIPPGVGVFFKKNTSAATLVFTGGVRVNDFAFPMPVGLSLRAPAYPVSYSAAALGGTTALGWTGNNNSGLADQLQVLNPTATGFTSYYLRTNGTEWRAIGGTVAVTTNLLFNYDSAFMVARKTSDVNYILTSPITL